MKASPSNTESDEGSRETVGDELSDTDSTRQFFCTKRRYKSLVVGSVLVLGAVLLAMVMGALLTSERNSNKNESDRSGNGNGIRGKPSLSPSNEPTMPPSRTPSPSEERLRSPTKHPIPKSSLQPTPNPTEKINRSNSPTQKQSSPPVR